MLDLGDLFLSHLSEVLILLSGKDFLCHLVVLEDSLEFVSSLDDRGQFLVLLVELDEPLHVADHLRVGKLRLKCFIFLLKA